MRRAGCVLCSLPSHGGTKHLPQGDDLADPPRRSRYATLRASAPPPSGQRAPRTLEFHNVKPSSFFTLNAASKGWRFRPPAHGRRRIGACQCCTFQPPLSRYHPDRFAYTLPGAGRSRQLQSSRYHILMRTNHTFGQSGAHAHTSNGRSQRV